MHHSSASSPPVAAKFALVDVFLCSFGIGILNADLPCSRALVYLVTHQLCELFWRFSPSGPQILLDVNIHTFYTACRDTGS